MKKVLAKVFIIFCIIIVAFIFFVLWDNNRLKVVEQDIMMDDLPASLENFTIVQLTDLHEKEFGKHQKRLVKKLNRIDYDVLIFTGDMIDGDDYTSVYSILEGINNKENVLFVPGNDDPPSYTLNPTFEKSAYVKGLEDRGARFVESFDSIKVGNEQVDFVNVELAIIENPEQIGNINGVFKSLHAREEAYKIYQHALWEETEFRDILEFSQMLIGLNHFPVVDVRIEYIRNDPATAMKDFDLIIAGHYHGGQIRLPFIGALFVPEAWYEPESLFPPQDRVKGLWEYDGIKQYVSAGLGSSESIKNLKFRLFNPPEINVLTLKGS